MSVIDTLIYTFKPKDEGVVKTLDAISSKSDRLKEANKKVEESFTELGNSAKGALSDLVPGADRLVNALGRVGKSYREIFGEISSGSRNATKVSQSTLRGGSVGGRPLPPSGGGGGSGVIPPPLPPSVGGGGAEGVAASAGRLSLAAGVAAMGLTMAAVAVTAFAKAAKEGAEELVKSRRAAQEAGINSIQQAAGERYAKNLGQSKEDFNSTVRTIAQTTQAGWVRSREFGNIFGLGNEQTQLLKRHGIATSSGGQLRNASAILDDITAKMIKMPREAGIAFGQFFGMSKDFATAIRDSGQTLSQYTRTHQDEIQTQARAIDIARAYERAQQNLSNAWDDFRVKVGGKVMPIITTLLEDIDKAVDGLDHFTDALQGFWETCKDLANKIKDWATNGAKDAVSGAAANVVDVFGGNSQEAKSKTRSFLDKAGSLLGPLLVPGYQKESVENVGRSVSSVAKDTTDYWAQKHKDNVENQKISDLMAANPGMTRDAAKQALTDKENREREEYMRKANQQTSDNAAAAKTQLEAANLMKVATARFGLSTEQYMAMWAATSGKAGGLAASGGVTNSDFRDIYKDVVGKFATPEVSEAMYLRGAPMMAQLPSQYAVGLGVTPLGIPRNAVGLSQAKEAVSQSNVPTVPSRFAKGSNVGGAGDKTNNYDINVKADIHTTSTDPQAIGEALSNHLSDQLKMATNSLTTGEK